MWERRSETQMAQNEMKNAIQNKSINPMKFRHTITTQLAKMKCGKSLLQKCSSHTGSNGMLLINLPDFEHFTNVFNIDSNTLHKKIRKKEHPNSTPWDEAELIPNKLQKSWQEMAWRLPSTISGSAQSLTLLICSLNQFFIRHFLQTNKQKSRLHDILC